jgi:hypothetical protein
MAYLVVFTETEIFKPALMFPRPRYFLDFEFQFTIRRVKRHRAFIDFSVVR